MENLKKVKEKIYQELLKAKYDKFQLLEIQNSETWSELKNVIANNIDWYIDDNITIPDDTYKNDKIKFTIHNGKLHGNYIEYFDNGKVEVEFNYKEGKLHGKCKVYHDNGQVYWESDYVNGKIYGEHVSYRDNGQMQEKSIYFDDKLKDKYLYFDGVEISYDSFINKLKKMQKETGLS